MAEYVVASGAIAVHDIPMASGVEAVVRLPESVVMVELIKEGAGAIFYTVDDSVPTVRGANTYKIPGSVVASDERQIGDPRRRTVRAVATADCVLSVQINSI